MVAITIPFALIGGVVAAWIAGGVLSLGSLIGFVTVLGIAARNGIMLVSHYRHLQQKENEPFGLNLIIRGAEERLIPILMTVLTTALALLPLAISGNKPGHEIEYPLAIVIVGGLDRVASGRYRPGAPTDPYVRALPHTVPQITLLRVCTLTEH